MDDDVVIGRDILQFAELVVSGTGTIVKKKVPTLFLAHTQVPEESNPFDDLTILAQNYKEAVERLALVLNIASEYGLKLNLIVYYAPRHTMRVIA